MTEFLDKLYPDRHRGAPRGKEVDRARTSLGAAAERYDSVITSVGSSDELKAAAIEYVRELLCAKLGLRFSDLGLDDLLSEIAAEVTVAKKPPPA